MIGVQNSFPNHTHSKTIGLPRMNRGSLIGSEVGRGHGLKMQVKRCVLVRVLRTWEARNFKRNKDLMSVDLLLLDEKDCLIQGSIHHQLLYKFRDNLREGGIFLIRDFEVFRSGIHYKLTDHHYIIRFTDATILEETVEENFVIPSEKFRLHSHSDLLSLMEKIDFLPDMIGFLYKVDTPTPSGANQSKRVILHICMEEGINLRLTIWDALADSFATKFKEIDERIIVIIATSILPKSFGEVGRGHGLKMQVKRCVLVLVLRTWEARNFKRNKDLMSVDLLLLDEKDCLIQGSIHHQLLYKFRDNLKEGGIFLIRDFEVFRSGIHYKLTDHDYIIRFTDTTILEETVEENFVIPSEKFRLHSHSDLLSLMEKIDFLPDMIGFLYKVDTPAPSGANQSKRVILHICMEEGINLRLTIWDALADSFATKFKEIDERIIVIIATSILPKSFGDRMFILKLKTALKMVRTKTMIPMIIVFLKYYPSSPTKKSRSKNSFARQRLQRSYYNGWNYISCSKCFGKMETENSSLNCSNCNDSHSVGVLRFRLEIEVDDGSDCTTFVIFDKDVKQLTKTTASELMAENGEDNVQDGRDRAPASILNIVGKSFKFQVKVTSYNFRAKYQSFTVSRIMNISEPATEEHLQKKLSVIGEAESSSSPTLAKIKIECVGEEKKTGKGSKMTVKR
ncbi:hypothetical protein ACS0TY_033838 [Phlomoides rotata]